jgi:hypothetical protein
MLSVQAHPELGLKSYRDCPLATIILLIILRLPFLFLFLFLFVPGSDIAKPYRILYSSERTRPRRRQ